MKFTYLFFALFLTSTSILSAQQKEISLEEIWDGTFSQERMESLQSLNNGKEYVVLNYDRENGTSSIDVYSYKTGKKTGSLVNSADLEDLKNFRSFDFSDNEEKLILATQLESIYRRSSRGIYYVYDIESKKL
ncbi:MAG TPA: S9 family peptidase, partial [Salinimicrobium sp.]|nr:S9 family peptidase [Salinimicrobium sp.]